VVKTLVIIPTYNERESLPRQVSGVFQHAPDAQVLVVDDGSPDGTGEWASEEARGEPRLHVLQRGGKQGLGAAYKAGFAWALERDYDVIVEMDADGSHQAAQLPDLLAKAGEGRLVIGSRWVPGGSVVNWPVHRKWLSQGANLYTRIMLGIAVRDSTAGFRAYSAATLRQVNLDDVESQGYCFQVDMTVRALATGARVVEVPIEFVERDRGESKMSFAIIREALWKITVWGLSRPFKRTKRA
jgi:dolichol-phosphate mannosyltransferase